MPKLKSTPITQKHLEEFLASESDFAFEMKVLSLLRNLNFDCKHSGTYQDPITKKIRQFDLRADKVQNGCRLKLAVECKNISPSCPLLISAVPRTAGEAFHEIIVYKGPARVEYMQPHAEAMNIANGMSIYVMNEAVGKRTDQVGETEHSSELVSDDALTFDKMNQAINSSEDLVAECSDDSEEPLIRAVVPVLVIPAGMLWQIDYDHNGKVVVPVRRVNEATVFIDHGWKTMIGGPSWLYYRISHLHIVAIDTLEAAVDRWMGVEGFFRIAVEARGRSGNMVL